MHGGLVYVQNSGGVLMEMYFVRCANVISESYVPHSMRHVCYWHAIRQDD
jgi:hypothetical protein